MFDLGTRILIVGCSGSGKTTLARLIKKFTGLPIIHLDNYYWNENWGRKSDNEWFGIVNDLCTQPQWIMDGNYLKTLPIRIPHATSVIYLDMPRWKCLFRAFIRRFRVFYNKKRDDIPTNCNERLNKELYQWIWSYPKQARKKTMKLLQDSHCKIYYLTSNHEICEFIKQQFIEL